MVHYRVVLSLLLLVLLVPGAATPQKPEPARAQRHSIPDPESGYDPQHGYPVMCEPPPGSVGDKIWQELERQAKGVAQVRAVAEAQNGKAAANGPVVKLPAEVRGSEAAFVVVQAETDLTTLRWVPLDPGLSLLPPHLLRDSRAAVVMGPRGRFRLLAYGARGDQPSEPAICVVIIGDAPPGPGPGPGPQPPDAPLVKELRAAYQADLAAGKAPAGILPFIAAVLRQAPSYLTKDKLLGQWHDRLKVALAEQVTPGSLPALGAALSSYLRTALPVDGNTPLTPEIQAKCKAACESLAAALEAIR